MARIYGLDADGALSALGARLVAAQGDRATVEVSYPLLGQSVRFEMELLRRDGRWYSYDAVTQALQTCARNVLCPNGDRCTSTGACLVPANLTTGAQCMADVTNRPLITSSAVPVPRINPVAPSGDGREYNQHLYLASGGGTVYQTGTFIASPPMTVTGAYYRIHTTRSMDPVVAPAVGVTCQFPDMTDQIGCLVQASPCSIGFAGRGTLDTNANTGAIKVFGQSPETACIQNNFTYPLSRKLYLSSVPGFANVTTVDEVALAGCETDLAQAGTPAGLVTTNPTTDLNQFGFINIAPTYNGGKPYCEDFNENMLCPTFAAIANTNSCPTASPLPNGLNFPTTNATVCGNAVKDQYEECDCGTTLVPPTDPICAGIINGGAGGSCSNTCRLNR